MLHNLIFDYGGVIRRFDREHLASVFCPHPADRPLLEQAIFHDWQAMDLGSIPEEEYLSHTLALLPERLHEAAKRFFCNWEKETLPMPGMEDLIERASEAGYRRYLLSNAPAHLFQNLSFYPFLQSFDGIVISGMIGIAKPDRRIYEHLLQKYALDPTECLFVDDMPENVAAAEACGIRSYRFPAENPEKGVRELSRLLFGQ